MKKKKNELVHFFLPLNFHASIQSSVTNKVYEDIDWTGGNQEKCRNEAKIIRNA